MARAAASSNASLDRGLVFDPGALIGLAATVVLIGTAILLGGQPQAFFDFPSIILVIFGTITATLISFPLSEFRATPRILGEALTLRRPAGVYQLARDCVFLANDARGKGVVGLTQNADRHKDKPILARGMIMLGDGLERDEVLPALKLEMSVRQENQENAQRMLRRAAEVAPAMGLIGTLVGLVQMLGQLDNPAAIGPSMAVALLTTLYGAFLAHAVLTPLAERLAGLADHDGQLQHLQFITVQSLVDNENPRLLETRLNGLLPPSTQLSVFD